MKAATWLYAWNRYDYVISIHAAREGGDTATIRQSRTGIISIHAAREGGDRRLGQMVAPYGRFQSTPPVKAATHSSRSRLGRQSISIHAAREGGDLNKSKEHLILSISIHAAREGGDFFIFETYTFCGIISIHAAREGGDAAIW